MAKTKSCRACGSQVSSSAKACPSCGEPTKKKAGCGQQLGGCLILCVLMGGCLAIVGPRVGKSIDASIEKAKAEAAANPDAWKTNNKSMALVMTQEFVTKQLKAPSTAKFASSLWDGAMDHVTPEGEGVYRVKSWVDSQNGFGAMIRTNFFARVQETKPGDWKLLELTVDE